MKETPHGVNGRFNVSRLSQSLPAIFHVWRSSRVSQHSSSDNYPRKSTNEDQLSSDNAFASLTDKDATLKDAEVANSKSLNTIMQCIQEDQECTDKGEYVQIIEQNNMKGNRSLEHGEKQTADNPLSHTNGRTLTQPLSDKQKQTSPLYMEVIDNVSRGLVNITISESSSEPENNNDIDVYSIPIDSLIDDSNAGERVISPRPKMVISKYQKRQSLTKPITSRQNSSSPSTHQPNNDVYSTPVDSLPRIITVPPESDLQGTTEEYSVPVHNEGTLLPSQNVPDYTSPVLATMAMNFNPSYNSVEFKDDDVDGYCDPQKSMKGDNVQTDDSVFAEAVASLLKNKQERCKPPQPKPYKLQNSYESDEVFRSASLPHNIAGRSHSDAETQKLPLHSTSGADTNSMKLKSTMSCGVASDLYTVPPLTDDACEEDKQASSFNCGKIKPSSNSLAKQQLNKKRSTSQSVQQDQSDDMYSVPVNAIENTNVDSMDTPSTVVMESNDAPPVPVKRKSESTDSPFADAVACLQQSKQKDKPSLPKPYKPQTSPSRELSPSPNLRNLLVINESNGDSQKSHSQSATADYIFPDKETTSQRNDSLEYCYVIPDQLRIPNFIDDICTGHTEC